jgi:excisionase family DNA binding protein
MDKLLSTREIADYLDLDEVTVRRKAAKGEIPSMKIGSRYRFDKIQIDDWLTKNKVNKAISIFVVDDNPIICSLFKETLERHGHKVTVCSNSRDALETMLDNQLDLIFLDIKMPELDGAELFCLIRQISNVPVAIITGYPDSDLMEKAMECGPFLVMKKPFDSVDIIGAVQSFNQIWKTKD